MKHEARAMLEQENGGVIVNLASIYGRQPGEGMSAYCSAKAGVEMLTRVAALELGPLGVRVNTIAPGFVDTPMTAPTQPKSRAAYIDAIPLGRPGQADDIARQLSSWSTVTPSGSTGRRWSWMAARCIARHLGSSRETAETTTKDPGQEDPQIAAHFKSAHGTKRPNSSKWKDRHLRPDRWSSESVPRVRATQTCT